jgi:hypothetical protein
MQVSAVESASSVPSDFHYLQGRASPGVQKFQRVFQRLFGFDPLPPEPVVNAFVQDMRAGDPVAEGFVDEVFFGAVGAKEGRVMLDRALERGLASVPEAPASMRRLFAEFETVPDWVDVAEVERGAAIWRRWGTDLFAVAGLGTLEMYTESAVAMPLSLTGGYAGDNALRRFLETARFWIDVSEPGALTTIGSAGRATAMRVRVMHVSVRRRVARHPEWSDARWGLPISQAYMLLTLMGGSVGPAFVLWLFGHVTTPSEIRALLHFQRFLGHLLGVHPTLYPNSIAEGVQLLGMTMVSRSYTSGEHGRELIESFPRALSERPAKTFWARVRNTYERHLYAGYLAILMQPQTRKLYDVPPAMPSLLLVFARAPWVALGELLQRIVPGLARRADARSRKRREAWLRTQLAGRTAAFEAASQLRR